MIRYRAARTELERHDWASYRSAPVAGPRIDDILLNLLDSESPAEVLGFTLRDRVEVRSKVFEVALPVIGVILAAYGESELKPWVEDEFLTTLHNVITGIPHPSELEAGNSGLVDQCIALSRAGIWVMYSRVTASNALFMLDILDRVDKDRDRFATFRSKLEYL